MNRITISAGDISLAAELNDSPTARQIWERLPMAGTANVWGEEIYFKIPVTAEQEPDARAQVEVGELGYWPVGQAFCIFFGPTPASIDERPCAYSPVNVIGELLGDISQLSSIQDGELVRIARMDRD